MHSSPGAQLPSSHLKLSASCSKAHTSTSVCFFPCLSQNKAQPFILRLHLPVHHSSSFLPFSLLLQSLLSSIRQALWPHRYSHCYLPCQAGTRNRGSGRFANLSRDTKAENTRGEGVETVRIRACDPGAKTGPALSCGNWALSCSHLPIPPGPCLDPTLGGRTQAVSGKQEALFISRSAIQWRPTLRLSGP